MLKVVIMGTGNVAGHLFEAFRKTEKATVVQVVGRNIENLAPFGKYASITTNFDQVADADIYMIAVNDDAIEQASAPLSKKRGLVVHTSGAVPMHSITSENRGVFYPLQTFTKGKSMDFRSIPLCIEAQDPDSLKLLKELGAGLSDHVHEINSEKRKKLHLAAVFVNNFTNHLYGIGEHISQTEGLSFDLLKPLITETAKKVQDLSPRLAQTGPARRGDEYSMQEHLRLLEETDHKKLYIQLSEAIRKAYEKKL